MPLELVVRIEVSGSPEQMLTTFVEDPGAWLPPPTRWTGGGAWLVELEAGPASRVVECRIGPVWTIGAERWRSVAWRPVPGRNDLFPVQRALPALSGEVGLLLGERRPALELHATYRPPGGPVGRLADAAALRRVAIGTARRFLEQVAAALADPAERPEHRRTNVLPAV